jgi:cell division inhibitor SepF
MTIFDRLWDALGLGTSIDEVEYEDDDPEADAAVWQDQPAAPPPSASNVIGLPGRGTVPPELVLFEPRSFAEIPQAVVALKQRKAVILNLSLVDADTAQRCVDFVAGGAFAIDGHQERVGETIFLFTPSFVQISHFNSAEPEISRSAVPPEPYPTPPRRPAPPRSTWMNSEPPEIEH